MENSIYIHLGNDISIHNKDIIGIFDIEKTTVEKSVNNFLAVSQKKGDIYYCSLDMPKSFIVTSEKVFISNVSTLTIKKRANFIKQRAAVGKISPVSMLFFYKK